MIPDTGVPFAVGCHTLFSSSHLPVAPFPGENTKAHIPSHRASQAAAETPTTDFAPSFCELHSLQGADVH